MLNLFQHPLVKSVVCKGLRVRLPNDKRVKNRIFGSSFFCLNFDFCDAVQKNLAFFAKKLCVFALKPYALIKKIIPLQP